MPVALERGAGAVGEVVDGKALGCGHAAREGDRSHRPGYRNELTDGRSTTKRAPSAGPLVAHVAAVSASVGARDREAEAGAGDAVARDAGAREALEQRLLELVRDARPGVLDRDAHGRRRRHARARAPAPGRSEARS